MSAPRQEQTILTPSQVGQYIKGFMDRDRVLSGLLVRGELSNYKMYPSGHHYFTLKDGEGALRCVMFRGDGRFPALSPAKRDASHRGGPGDSVSPGRTVPAVLCPADAGGRGRSGGGL